MSDAETETGDELATAQSLVSDPAGDPAPDTAAGAPDVEAGVPSPEPDPPAGPQIDWNDPEVAAAIEARADAAIERRIQQAQEAAQQAAQPQPETPGLPDPFSDTYEQEMAAYVAWQVEQRVSGFTPMLEQAQARENEQWTNQQLETLGIPVEPGIEDGSTTRDILLYAAGGLAQAAEMNGMAIGGDQLMKAAWQQMQTRDQRVAEAAVAKYRADLDAVAGAPQDPSGSVGATEGMLDADDELAVARLIAERRSAA